MSGTAHSGDIAFHVGEEDRHAYVGEAFRQHLKGDCFTGTGGAGNQSVAVRHARVQEDLLVALTQ